MNTHFGIVAVLALSLTAHAASAAVIVEPDAFPDGTNITIAFPGVTLTDVTGGSGTLNPVHSRTSPITSTGTRVFGRSNGELSWGNGAWDFLRIDVAGFTNSASLDFISDDPSDANPVLAAYDVAGALLTFSTAPGSFATGTIVPLTVSAPNIATVLALGDPLPGSFDTIAEITAVTSGGADNWAVDNFQYDVVPEPATPALVALAGMALAAARCRRSRIDFI